MKNSSLGDRMKRYEAAYDLKFTPRTPLVVRVDGRAFHTFMRGSQKPFDTEMIEAMIYAAKAVAGDMQGFKLAYIQSDEANFVMTDYDSLSTQGWFDYRLNKVVSIAASSFTAAFNYHYEFNKPNKRNAVFDARAFSMPIDDVPNLFVWRQQDWERNSVQMLARAHFSHKECHKKSVSDLHEMLFAKGINWAHLDPVLKNGTFITHRNGETSYDKLSYDQISAHLTPTEGEDV